MFTNKVERIRILIVDDEPTIHVILKDALEAFGEVHHAYSGLDGLEQALNLKPDVIMLDIHLPDLTGHEVSTAILEQRQELPPAIIFITADVEGDHEFQSLRDGGVDFITKPLNLAICRQRVKNHLANRERLQRLALQQQYLQGLVGQVPVFISHWDAGWHNQFCNDSKGLWFDSRPTEMKGRKLEELLPKELCELVKSQEQHISKKPLLIDFHCKERVSPSAPEFIQVYLSTRQDGDNPPGFLLTMVDISPLKRDKDQLHQETEKLKVTLSSIGDGVIATDTRGYVTFMNPIAERMTGWPVNEAVDRDIREVMRLTDGDSTEEILNPIFIALNEQRIAGMALNSILQSRSGQTYHVEDSASPIKNEQGDLLGAIIVFHDVSEAVAMSIKMSHLANFDQLTNLPNRILLQDRITQAIGVAQESDLRMALMMIDIDNFKLINDQYGHGAGDLVIQQVAERLSGTLLPQYTLSRLGGDEFVLVVPSFNKVADLQRLMKAMNDSMSLPITVNKDEITLSVSIGVSIYPSDARSQEGLLGHAEAAMYRTKQDPEMFYSFYSDELEQRLIARHKVVQRLRSAIAEHALEVVYQPKVKLQTHEVMGAEALVRLPDGEGGYISPAEFIPLAEQHLLIVELGHQVMDQACQQLVRWTQINPSMSIAVNVSALQLTTTGLVAHVQKMIERYQFKPEQLELEITESSIMENFEKAQQTLAELSAMGVSIAIDDFGTGYSSLAYLKKFHADTLKVDMSFIHDMLDDESDKELVNTIVSLGKSMKLNVVAEGIELQQQEVALISMECDLGQGYLYSRPLSADDFFAHIKA